MTRSRKLVALALVASLWVATFGFVPRVTSASPSSNEVRHSCIDIAATAFSPAGHVCTAAPQSNPVESDHVYFDADGPDVACCKVSSTFPVPAPSPSIGEHSDRAHVRSHWDSLAARGPPQR